MLSVKHQVEDQVETDRDMSLPRWNIGVERRLVALYVSLALIRGFAAGFATYKYAVTTNNQPPHAGIGAGGGCPCRRHSRI